MDKPLQRATPIAVAIGLMTYATTSYFGDAGEGHATAEPLVHPFAFIFAIGVALLVGVLVYMGLARPRDELGGVS